MRKRAAQPGDLPSRPCGRADCITASTIMGCMCCRRPVTCVLQEPSGRGVRKSIHPGIRTDRLQFPSTVVGDLRPIEINNHKLRQSFEVDQTGIGYVRSAEIQFSELHKHSKMGKPVVGYLGPTKL